MSILHAGQEAVSPIRRHRLILVVASIPIVAVLSFVLINMPGGKLDHGQFPSCSTNLREIRKLCIAFAKGEGIGSFPDSPDGGHGALQLLVDYYDGLKNTIYWLRLAEASNVV